jgi:hypothetical protein
VADGGPCKPSESVERMGPDDYVPSLAKLRHCESCGRRKARASDGFCGGCGARPGEAAMYESEQVLVWRERAAK